MPGRLSIINDINNLFIISLKRGRVSEVTLFLTTLGFLFGIQNP